MPFNVKAVVRYDGGPFAGWQIQPDSPTVQGVIEKTLSVIASRPVRITGAGRTDAGVHALGQVFSFQWHEEPPLALLRKSLSKILGPSIRIESMESVDDLFNARFSAKGKRYAYSLLLAHEPDPFAARHSWCIPWALDMELMAACAQQVAGTHDFAGFQCAGASVKTTHRTLHSVKVLRGGVVGPCDAESLWRLEFAGNGFLYKMVRNITGTLVDIARGKTPPARIAELLESRGPFRGYTAPSHGLTLLEVIY
jgi:tRNA pseudouridine38-40 synthase